MKTVTLPRTEAERVLRSSEGSFFSVAFIKRGNQRTRRMTARLGVTKGVKGTGMSYDPAAKGLLPVFDAQNGRRMIDLNTVLQAQVKGVRYLFD